MLDERLTILSSYDHGDGDDLCFMVSEEFGPAWWWRWSMAGRSHRMRKTYPGGRCLVRAR